MVRESVNGQLVINIFDSEIDGVYQFDELEQSLIYVCPCGCKQHRALPIRQFNEHPSWQWDGNKEKPTLSPSIKHLDGCKFHGFLKAGVWSFCEDSGQ